jgi:hypothetical protein
MPADGAKGLTIRQKQYIWIMGSHPDRIATQGRGRRVSDLLYGFYGDDEVVIFGYSEPFLWLDNRGLTRPLANNRRARVLTDEGEKVFQRLLLSGFGDGAAIREVKVQP